MLARVSHLFIFFLLIASYADENVNLAQKMIDAKIVPDFIRNPPDQVCRVFYKYGEVHPGEVWLCNRTEDIPNVTWQADPKAHYCLYFGSINRFDDNSTLHIYTGPPVSTRPAPYIDLADLWVVINIPGNNLAAGKTIVEYSKPAPPIDTIVRLGVVEHYVFLIYKQPTDRLNVKEAEFRNTGIMQPDTHNVTKFEIDCGLGKPVAGNFFVLTGEDLYRRPKTSLLELRDDLSLKL